jgi:hypothetical protein
MAHLEDERHSLEALHEAADHTIDRRTASRRTQVVANQINSQSQPLDMNMQ